MTTTNDIDQQTRQKRLVLAEPDAGWSRESYDRELDAYVAARGRLPQTVTMHADTAQALGLHDSFSGPNGQPPEPLVITSSDYARRIITLYY